MTNSYFSQGFKPPTSIGGLIREAGVWSLSSLSSGSFGSLTGWVNTYEIQASTGCLNMVNWKVLVLKSPLSKMMHGGYCRVGQNHTHSIPINHNQKYEQYDRLIHMNQLGFMLLSHWGLEIYTWAYPHLSANECDFYGTSHDPSTCFTAIPQATSTTSPSCLQIARHQEAAKQRSLQVQEQIREVPIQLCSLKNSGWIWWGIARHPKIAQHPSQWIIIIHQESGFGIGYVFFFWGTLGGWDESGTIPIPQMDTISSWSGQH